jgi:uncharacterized protein (TIGR04552 family)
MGSRFHFDPDVLRSMAGGLSAIDNPRLNVTTVEAARQFIKSYGYDLSQDKDLNRIWYFHRRALVLLTEKLGYSESEIPEVLRDRKQLGDISQLLLFASSRRPQDKQLQRWACAILRCMHVYIHSESDLFSSFTEEIQSQILTPFQSAIVHDGSSHRTYLKSQSTERNPIELVGFEVKPFKASTSTVIKLLAKPDALAMKVFDKLGVRFITQSLFDSFQVIRFMVEENLINFAHIIPDQSSNNLFPVDLFLEVCEWVTRNSPDSKGDELSSVFDKALDQAGDKAKMFRKINEQSAEDFRFIKFITRKLIHINLPGREPFTFFYPFEIQIMDKKSHEMATSGPSEHEAYKERQRQTARRRVLPDVQENP